MRVVYELFHDTSFGYVLRAVLGRHAFAYPDELEGAESLKRCLRSATAPNTPAAPNTPGPVPLEKATREDLNPSNEVSDALAAETAERTGRTPIPPSRAFHPEGSDDRHSTASTRVDMGAIEPAQKKAEAGYDRDLVGWYDENDIDNPQNWSKMKKLWVTWQTVFLCFGIYLGSAIFAGGMPEIEEKFGVSDVVATIGLCLYVIGYGIGPVFFAPLTEIPQIGRMPVYVVTLFLFLMLNIPLAKATNIGMVLSFRFLTGFFGSPILSVGGATMADMWSSSSRMYAIFMWCFFAHVAVVMGPLLGGFIGFYKGSAWITWMLMALNGAVFIHLFFFFPETNPSSILYHRARRLRKATQNKELRSQSEIDAANTKLMDIVTVALIRPLVFNVTEPIVIALNTWLGLIYAVLYLWFESFPMVFYDGHHLPLQNVGLTYIGLLVGTFMAAPPFLLWWKWVQVPKFAKYGKDLKPEEVLPSAIVAAILVPICLFWFGWTSHPDIHWIVPIIASSLFGAASVILFTVILDYLANTYPLYAASVLAGNALVRCSFAGSWPIFARALYHTIGIDWASTMLGFFSAAFAFIPILLYIYGVKIRNMSKRARHDY